MKEKGVSYRFRCTEFKISLKVTLAIVWHLGKIFNLVQKYGVDLCTGSTYVWGNMVTFVLLYSVQCISSCFYLSCSYLAHWHTVPPVASDRGKSDVQVFFASAKTSAKYAHRAWHHSLDLKTDFNELKQTKLVIDIICTCIWSLLLTLMKYCSIPTSASCKRSCCSSTVPPEKWKKLWDAHQTITTVTCVYNIHV